MITCRQSFQKLSVVVAVLLVGLPAAARAKDPDRARPFTFDISGTLVRNTSLNAPLYEAKGLIVGRLPKWKALGGVPAPAFRVTESAACTSYVSVSAFPMVARPPRDTPNSMVGDEVLYETHRIAGAHTRKRAWAVSQMPDAQTQLVDGNPAAHRVYAVTIFAIAPRRVMEVKALADFVGDCPQTTVRAGRVTSALRAMSPGLTFQGELVKSRPK